MSSSEKSMPKMTHKARIRALGNVAKTTYRASPGAVVVKLVGALITAIIPLVIAYFAAQTTTALADGFVDIQGAGDRAIRYVIITAVLGIVMSAWYSIQSYINELTAYRINAAVSDRLYEHFIAIEYWRYDDKDTADMFDRAQNFALFFSRFFDVISRLISSTTQVLISVVALVSVNRWIGLLLFAAIVPSALVQFRLSRLQSAQWRRTTEVRRKALGITYSVFQAANLAELRMYNAARAMLDLRAKYRDQDQLERIAYERKYIVWRIASDIIEAAAEVIALMVIALQIIRQIQPVGQFIYVQQLVSRTLSGMHSLTSEFNSIDEDLVTMFDYEQFMQLPVVSTGGAILTEAPDSIVFDKVCFRYPNAQSDVLRNISLEIKKGQHVAIVGENGAGKSTLIKQLMGLYRPSSGDVLVDHVPLSSIDENSWHRIVSVLQQNFIQYQFANIRENVAFGDLEREFDEDRYRHSLLFAEAAEFIKKLAKKDETIPNQWYETDDGVKGQELSGGQWQRIALARSFYRACPIIILDEPTSAIDALAESRIFKELFGLRDKTVVTISHRLTTIKRADIIYMLEDGRIVEQGTVDELIDKHGAFYRMFESQIK